MWGQPPSAVRRAQRGPLDPRTLVVIPTREQTRAAEESAFRTKHYGESLAILAIKQIPHGFTPSRVRSLVRLQNIRRLRLRIGLLFAARRTAVGKPRLPRLQLKLLRANRTNFNRKSHRSMIQKRIVFPNTLCHSDPRANARGGGICFATKKIGMPHVSQPLRDMGFPADQTLQRTNSTSKRIPTALSFRPPSVNEGLRNLLPP